MRRFRSIRLRLVGLIGLLLLLVLGSFGSMAWHRECTARLAAVDRALEERLNLLITGFRPVPGQRVDEVTQPRYSTRAAELFANKGGEPFYYIVWRADGQRQAQSDRAPDLALPHPSPEAKVPRMRGNFRELIHHTPTGRCFLVGRSMEQERAAMRADAGSLSALGGGILLLGLALAWWIASTMTRPLAEVSRTAKQIAAGDLSRRIHTSPSATKDELGELVEVLNDTFSRLEDAFARQKQFTADASHELRTPVSLILAHAQGALLHEQSPADYREALTDCVQAAQRMKALIESLLELARFDANAEPLQLAPCDLAALTTDSLALLRPLYEAKSLNLSLALHPTPCRVDPGRIKQVITNLIANAIHFTPPGGSITLSTRVEGGAKFTITDTGPGIDAAHLPQLFERFHRGDTSRTRSTGGNGLGLAICKAIMDAHRGAIGVSSEPGKGTSIAVFFPDASSPGHSGKLGGGGQAG